MSYIVTNLTSSVLEIGGIIIDPSTNRVGTVPDSAITEITTAVGRGLVTSVYAGDQPALGMTAQQVTRATPSTVQVATGRDLTAADDGKTLECTATITLNVPAGLPAGFQCDILPSGTTSISRSGGALLNGAGTTLTRAAATAGNAVILVRSRASAVDSYVVSGS